MRPRILITGSSGMLGIDLSQELNGDCDVYGVDLNEGRRTRDEGRFYQGDITDRKSIADIIKKIEPDIIIHAAAWTDVDGCESDKEKAYRINSEGTKNVAIACKKAAAILIYISTDFIFDGRKKTPYKETDKPRPLSVYGESKFNGEKAVKKTLKKYFIVRTSWLYGKHGKNFVDTILEKAKSGKELKVVNDQIGSPTYTKDLAKALHALLHKIFTQYSILNTQYGIYHISNSGSVSWYEYAKEILKLAGSKTNVVPISSKELNRPAKRPAMSILDNSKFIKFSGYKMRRWEDALKEYLGERKEDMPC